MRGRTASLGEELLGLAPSVAAVGRHGLECGEHVTVLYLNAEVAEEAAVIELHAEGLAGEIEIISLGLGDSTAHLICAVLGIYNKGADRLAEALINVARGSDSADPKESAVLHTNGAVRRGCGDSINRSEGSAHIVTDPEAVPIVLASVFFGNRIDIAEGILRLGRLVLKLGSECLLYKLKSEAQGRNYNSALTEGADASVSVVEGSIDYGCRGSVGLTIIVALRNYRLSEGANVSQAIARSNNGDSAVLELCGTGPGKIIVSAVLVAHND